MAPDSNIRCGWCESSPLYQDYHDREWGVPLRDDRALFEFLVLEGAQAGLSWITILKKRAAYRQAFAGFDPEQVARFGPQDEARLLADSAIVRNRLKISSAIQNAKAFLKVRDEFNGFAPYIWRFTDGRPIINHWEKLADIPAQTPLAQTISKDLRRRGFNFVGPTIVYAHMQATGMVNDHLVSCFRHAQLGG